MGEEKGLGVFGAISDSGQNTFGESKKVILKVSSDDSSDTIYNLIFKEFDEEKVNE